jgi:hypothetical protein
MNEVEEPMAKYKPYNYDQMVMIPITLEDQLEPGTLEYTIHELVENNIDLSMFEERYQNDDNGAAAINPKILLKVILFAYARGMIGSRQIERACNENIIFMAFESLVIGAALIILVIQVASLINLLQNEVKPILDATNETVNTLRGTTTFLSENLVEPVIKLNSYLAGLRRFFQLFSFRK